ncbi:uncharacterized protein [Dendropsophus ebraccatus]|uniref:uncharacterized protein n=1 Tax=Dendropsophus ebraccatus TaxID=150705 RepID=UPI003831130A
MASSGPACQPASVAQQTPVREGSVASLTTSRGRRRARSSSSSSTRGSSRRSRRRSAGSSRYHSRHRYRESRRRSRGRRSRSSRWRSPSSSASSTRSSGSDRERRRRRRRREPSTSARESHRGVGRTSAEGVSSIPVSVPTSPAPVGLEPPMMNPCPIVDVRSVTPAAASGVGVSQVVPFGGSPGASVPASHMGPGVVRLMPLIQSSVSQATWNNHEAHRPAVWLLGHSYIHRAAQRAEGRPGGRSLGFRQADVHWKGIPGLRWSEVLSEAIEIGRLAAGPVVLLIHAGEENFTKSQLEVWYLVDPVAMPASVRRPAYPLEKCSPGGVYVSVKLAICPVKRKINKQ